MEKSAFTPEHRILVTMLREEREKAALTQAQLAKKLGVTQSLISKWENHDIRIDLVQLQAVCVATGGSLSRFVKNFEKRVGKK